MFWCMFNNSDICLEQTLDAGSKLTFHEKIRVPPVLRLW